MIQRAAQQYGVSPALIRGVIQAESSGNAKAQSSVGAQGLMQLMPDTAKQLGVTNAFDPMQNIMGGARYLSGLMQRYGGKANLALAAYNAGPGAVDKYGGVPPYKETQNYVNNILSGLGSSQ